MNREEAKEFVKKAILTGNKAYIQKVLLHYRKAFLEPEKTPEKRDIVEIAQEIFET
jgi:hypothetical protein